MNTPLLNPAVSVSPASAAGRGSDAPDSSAVESFGQVMARVDAQTRPDAAAAGNDGRQSDARGAKPAGKGDESLPQPKIEPSDDGTEIAEDPTAAVLIAELFGDETAPAVDLASSTQAAELINALLLPPMTTPSPVGPLPGDVGVTPPTTQEAADMVADATLVAATTKPSDTRLPALDSVAANVIPQETKVASAGPGTAAPNEPRPAVAAASAAVADDTPANAVPATAAGDIATDDHDAQSTAAIATAGTPKTPGTDRRDASPPVMRQAPPSPHEPIAEPVRLNVQTALAALARQSARPGEGESAFAATPEPGVEPLAGPRASFALRMEPAIQAAPMSNLPTSITSTHFSAVSTPVDQPGFAQDFGAKVVLLATGHVKSAELALTPPELGPVRVNIEVRGQDASISFVAAAATTRAALEEALPRLREMFAQQGLNLLDANVGAQVGQQGQRAYGRSAAPKGKGEEHGTVAASTVGGITPATAGRPVRLIDVIA